MLFRKDVIQLVPSDCAKFMQSQGINIFPIFLCLLSSEDKKNQAITRITLIVLARPQLVFIIVSFKRNH